MKIYFAEAQYLCLIEEAGEMSPAFLLKICHCERGTSAATANFTGRIERWRNLHCCSARRAVAALRSQWQNL